MFGLSWTELFLVFIIALVVVGPKDTPKIMRFMGAMMARLRNMMQGFQKSWGSYMQLDQYSEVKDKPQKVETLDGEALKNDESTSS